MYVISSIVKQDCQNSIFKTERYPAYQGWRFTTCFAKSINLCEELKMKSQRNCNWFLPSLILTFRLHRPLPVLGWTGLMIMACNLTTPQSVADIRQEQSPYCCLTGSGNPGLNSIPTAFPESAISSQMLGLSSSVNQPCLKKKTKLIIPCDLYVPIYTCIYFTCNR